MDKKEKILKKIFEYNSAISPGDDLKIFKKFWLKSYNHFNIIMLLSSIASDEQGYSYEEICALYPHKLASRTTILSILNEGLENNFFIKRIDTVDHRKHNYKLSPHQKKDVIKWVDNHPINSFNK